MNSFAEFVRTLELRVLALAREVQGLESSESRRIDVI